MVIGVGDGVICLWKAAIVGRTVLCRDWAWGLDMELMVCEMGVGVAGWAGLG